MTAQPSWGAIYAKIDAGDEAEGEIGNESEHVTADESADDT